MVNRCNTFLHKFFIPRQLCNIVNARYFHSSYCLYSPIYCRTYFTDFQIWITWMHLFIHLHLSFISNFMKVSIKLVFARSAVRKMLGTVYLYFIIKLIYRLFLTLKRYHPSHDVNEDQSVFGKNSVAKVLYSIPTRIPLVKITKQTSLRYPSQA